MRKDAIWQMLAALAVGVVVSGCPTSEDGLTIDADAVIRVNNASEEVLGTIVDAINAGQLQVDDDKAAALVAPAPGQTVPADPALTFAWTFPQAAVKRGDKTPRHGTISGDYAWLRISGEGLARDIDVVAVDVTAWTPDAATWEELEAAGGTLAIRLVSAYVLDGVIMDGPYEGTSLYTFAIGE